MKENEILASFISRLPEAIIICDSKGAILLHDSQSETYLRPGRSNQSISGPMTGRPITSLIDKNLVEYALDEINEQLKQAVSPLTTPVVSTFILQKKGLILQAQIVPVLNMAGLFKGFVLILDDITQKNRAEKRVEALLKTLSKNARSPMASIRAAIEAMREFPNMDLTRQHQFKEIIYKESIVLSDLLNSVSDEYSNLIHVKTSLKPLFVTDLLKTVSRRSLDKLSITCHIKRPDNAERITIKSDPYSLISALLFVLNQMKIETGLNEYDLIFYKQDKIVLIDIAWKGESLTPNIIKQWEPMDTGIQDTVSHISLKQVLNRHYSALMIHARQDTGKETPCLRFLIPASESLSPDVLEPVSTLPENRIHIRDIELFDHSDQARELDSRLLTELSYTSLIREVNQASRIEDIIGKHSQLPRLIHSMLTSGTKIRTVTWLITALSDAILNKLMTFAIAELGPSPVPFAFVTLGSEGRKEQTLKTDQDNAIIFQDPKDGQTIERLQAYFLKLGEKVCTLLDQSGFDFCQGGIMAKNPRWCQPLSVWKDYFSSWIHAASPEDLLHTSIFFDFRFAWGDPGITSDLTTHLEKSLSNWAGFFRNMARNAVYFKPPIGFFGNFSVRKKAPFKHCLDIKMANIPIVDFARIYALKHQIKETSTQNRLYQLYVKKVLSRKDYNELEQAYCFNLQLRFMGQLEAILGQGMKPENYINPRHLSSIERKMLKEVLKKIKELQAKLSFDFIGATGSPG